MAESGILVAEYLLGSQAGVCLSGRKSFTVIQIVYQTGGTLMAVSLIHCPSSVEAHRHEELLPQPANPM